jgi:hypothetical protein
MHCVSAYAVSHHTCSIDIGSLLSLYPLNLSDPSDRLAPSPKDDTWMASHTTPKGLEHVG